MHYYCAVIAPLVTDTNASSKRSHPGSLKPRQQGHNNKTACSFLEADDRVIYLERKCIIIVLSSHHE